ncbi:helix-turn-helix domain-containing protein [uncultured Deefgea sp.]|uniref:helix-turn-helix domain-containing protein n=1 Tax=uncultured Deefgea sp. TaxID=1304914 RepID=UPI0025982FDE|nr:helix-turn-helix transcriptional regulator [uncultured Deefgea sp.]
MSVDIGNRVRSIRNALKLNQRDFAARLSTSSGRISEIESGKSMPSGDFLLRLHQEFNSDLNWLMTGMQGSASGIKEPSLSGQNKEIDQTLLERVLSMLDDIARAAGKRWNENERVACAIRVYNHLVREQEVVTKEKIERVLRLVVNG